MFRLKVASNLLISGEIQLLNSNVFLELALYTPKTPIALNRLLSTRLNTSPALKVTQIGSPLAGQASTTPTKRVGWR